MWYSQTLDPDPSGPPDYRAGLFACCFVYLGYSTLQGPSSVMIRPHPAFWKLIHGVCMIYLLALVFMLVQGKDAARQMLKVRTPAPTYPSPAFPSCVPLDQMHRNAAHHQRMPAGP